LPPLSPATRATNRSPSSTALLRAKAAAPLRCAAALQNLTEPRRAWGLLILISALGLLTAPLSAQSLGGGQFTLNGGPVTGGGGKSDGGQFAVTGGSGETSPAPLTGGTFEVTGGLVGVAVVLDDVTPELIITDTGEARLTWSAETTGYVLESTTNVGEFADWEPVSPAPAGNTYTTPFNQPLRFFRLRKP